MFELETLQAVFDEMMYLIACHVPASRVWWDADENKVITEDDVMEDYDADSEWTPDEYMCNFIDAVSKGRNDCYTFDEVEEMLNEKREEEAWLNEDDEEDD